MNFDEICNEHFDQQKKRFRKLKQICQFYHFCERNSSCLLKFCFKKMKTKNFKSFMRTIIAKKFKIWLLWTLNAYFDMKIVFSLNNYWRVSKMMMLIVVDRKLKKKNCKKYKQCTLHFVVIYKHTIELICTFCLLSKSSCEKTQTLSNFNV